MKKLFFTTLMLSGISAMAQMDMHMGKMHKDTNVTITTYRNIGISFQEFDHLNERINKFSQYRGVPEAIITIGMGSITHIGRFVSTSGITIGYNQHGSKDEKSTSLGMIGINGDLGVNIFKKTSRVELYPLVGLGLEGYRARFNKNLSAVPFDSVLGSNTVQNNIRSVTFKNMFFTYRAGLNLAVKSKDQSCAFGLQVGYTGSFKDREWRVNEEQMLQNAPKDNLSRFYGNLFMTKKLNWGHKRHDGG